MAATWPAISAQLPNMSSDTARSIRRVLQNNYFQLYVREYGLAIIRNLPWMFDDFGLGRSDRTYDFRFFSSVVDALGLKSLVFNLEPESLLRVRANFGFLEFLDLFADLGGREVRDAAALILWVRRLETRTLVWSNWRASGPE